MSHRLVRPLLLLIVASLAGATCAAPSQASFRLRRCCQAPACGNPATVPGACIAAREFGGVWYYTNCPAGDWSSFLHRDWRDAEREAIRHRLMSGLSPDHAPDLIERIEGYRAHCPSGEYTGPLRYTLAEAEQDKRYHWGGSMYAPEHLPLIFPETHESRVVFTQPQGK
jgi:hypothetical protein